MTQCKLSVPEEFVLLLHKPNGTHYIAHDQTHAAEYGERLLREWDTMKRKITEITENPEDDDWGDELFEGLAKTGGNSEPEYYFRRLVFRFSSIRTHRASLIDLGLLTHKPNKFLGFVPDDRYYPHEITRSQLIATIGQAARDDQCLDNHLAVLCALVHASGLDQRLGYDEKQRGKLKKISNGETISADMDRAVAETTKEFVTLVARKTVTVPSRP